MHYISLGNVEKNNLNTYWKGKENDIRYFVRRRDLAGVYPLRGSHPGSACFWQKVKKTVAGHFRSPRGEWGWPRQSEKPTGNLKEKEDDVRHFVHFGVYTRGNRNHDFLLGGNRSGGRFQQKVEKAFKPPRIY